ncbi:NADPH-dependent FMN reductase [Hyaloraphidium curvatum]|nr:NADPH-dependent FMN reductase [Hyaloraphidium curvatum]
MSRAIRLLIIPGSARTGSLNKKLAHVAEGIAKSKGAQTTVLDLRALDLPIYDGDLEKEKGVPKGAETLVTAIHESDAVLFVTPEYNSFPTPLLLNSLDWLSRVGATSSHPDGLTVTNGKPGALMAASPGAFGGIRSLTAVRMFLGQTIGFMLVPTQFALGRAFDAFDEHGALKDPRAKENVEKVVDHLLGVAGKMTAGSL